MLQTDNEMFIKAPLLVLNHLQTLNQAQNPPKTGSKPTAVLFHPLLARLLPGSGALYTRFSLFYVRF